MDEADARRLIERLGREVVDQPAPLPTLVWEARRARRRRRHSRVLITSGAGALVVAAAVLTWGPSNEPAEHATEFAAPPSNSSAPAPPHTCPGGSKQEPSFSEPLSTKPPFPTNANGQTYGSDAGAERLRDSPDLVAVAGDCGVAGYVRADDLNGPRPTSPADALRIQREQELSPPVLPVYLSDGTTQVDTFTLSVGASSP